MPCDERTGTTVQKNSTGTGFSIKQLWSLDFINGCGRVLKSQSAARLFGKKPMPIRVKKIIVTKLSRLSRWVCLLFIAGMVLIGEAALGDANFVSRVWLRKTACRKTQ
jgi:hypothetical protein